MEIHNPHEKERVRLRLRSLSINQALQDQVHEAKQAFIKNLHIR